MPHAKSIQGHDNNIIIGLLPLTPFKHFRWGDNRLEACGEVEKNLLSKECVTSTHWRPLHRTIVCGLYSGAVRGERGFVDLCGSRWVLRRFRQAQLDQDFLSYACDSCFAKSIILCACSEDEGRVHQRLAFHSEADQNERKGNSSHTFFNFAQATLV